MLTSTVLAEKIALTDNQPNIEQALRAIGAAIGKTQADITKEINFVKNQSTTLKRIQTSHRYDLLPSKYALLIEYLSALENGNFSPTAGTKESQEIIALRMLAKSPHEFEKFKEHLCILFLYGVTDLLPQNGNKIIKHLETKKEKEGLKKDPEEQINLRPLNVTAPPDSQIEIDISDDLTNLQIDEQEKKTISPPSTKQQISDEKAISEKHRKLLEAFFSITEFEKSVAKNIEQILSPNKIHAPTAIKEYISALTHTIRSLITYKNSLDQYNPLRKQIDYYIDNHKHRFNEVLIVLKTQSQDKQINVVKLISNEVESSFQRYQRSLFRETFGAGLQQPEKEKEKIKTENGIALLKCFGDSAGTVDKNLLTKFNNIHNMIFEEAKTKSCEQLLEDLDALITALQEKIKNISSLLPADCSQEIKENLWATRSFLEKLKNLRIRVENEYFLFHGINKNHTGKFGFINPTSFLENTPSESENEPNKARIFGKQRAERQVSEAVTNAINVITHAKFRSLNFVPTIWEEGLKIWNSGQTDKVSPSGSFYATKKMEELSTICKNNSSSIINKGLQIIELCTTTSLEIPLDNDLKERRKFFQQREQLVRGCLEDHAIAVEFLATFPQQTTASPKDKTVTESYTDLIVKQKLLAASTIKTIVAEKLAGDLFDGNFMRRQFAKLFTSINTQEFEERINNAIGGLPESKTTQDCIMVLSQLTEISQDLAKYPNYHPMKQLYTSVTQFAVRSIIATYFLQNIHFSINSDELEDARGFFMSAFHAELLEIENHKKGFHLSGLSKSLAKVEEIFQKLEQKKGEIKAKSLDISNLSLTKSKETKCVIENILAKYATNDADSLKANRIKRFNAAMEFRFTTSSFSKYTLASGEVTPEVSKHASVAQKTMNAIGALAPKFADATAVVSDGIGAVDQYATKKNAKNTAKSMGEPLAWFKFLSKQLLPILVKAFEQQVSKMEGENDVENFADLCLVRIFAELESEANRFQKAKTPEEKVACLISAVLTRTENQNFFPIVANEYELEGEPKPSWWERPFAKVPTFQKLVNNVSIVSPANIPAAAKENVEIKEHKKTPKKSVTQNSPAGKGKQPNIEPANRSVHETRSWGYRKQNCELLEVNTEPKSNNIDSLSIKNSAFIIYIDLKKNTQIYYVSKKQGICINLNVTDENKKEIVNLYKKRGSNEIKLSPIELNDMISYSNYTPSKDSYGMLFFDNPVIAEAIAGLSNRDPLTTGPSL